MHRDETGFAELRWRTMFIIVVMVTVAIDYRRSCVCTIVTFLQSKFRKLTLHYNT